MTGTVRETQCIKIAIYTLCLSWLDFRDLYLLFLVLNYYVYLCKSNQNMIVRKPIVTTRNRKIL